MEGIETEIAKLSERLEAIEAGRLRNYEREIVDVFSRISAIEARIAGMKDGTRKDELTAQVEEMISDYGLSLFD